MGSPTPVYRNVRRRVECSSVEWEARKHHNADEETKVRKTSASRLHPSSAILDQAATPKDWFVEWSRRPVYSCCRVDVDPSVCTYI